MCFNISEPFVFNITAKMIQKANKSTKKPVLAKIIADLAKKKAEKRKKCAVFSKKWRKYLQIWQFCCTFAKQIKRK